MHWFLKWRGIEGTEFSSTRGFIPLGLKWDYNDWGHRKGKGTAQQGFQFLSFPQAGTYTCSGATCSFSMISSAGGTIPEMQKKWHIRIGSYRKEEGVPGLKVALCCDAFDHSQILTCTEKPNCQASHQYCLLAQNCIVYALHHVLDTLSQNSSHCAAQMYS